MSGVVLQPSKQADSALSRELSLLFVLAASHLPLGFVVVVVVVAVVVVVPVTSHFITFMGEEGTLKNITAVVSIGVQDSNTDPEKSVNLFVRYVS